jgi:hypothetical protein
MRPFDFLCVELIPVFKGADAEPSQAQISNASIRAIAYIPDQAQGYCRAAANLRVGWQ